MKSEMEFLKDGHVKADNDCTSSHETSAKRLRLEEESVCNKTVKKVKVCK